MLTIALTALALGLLSLTWGDDRPFVYGASYAYHPVNLQAFVLRRVDPDTFVERSWCGDASRSCSSASSRSSTSPRIRSASYAPSSSGMSPATSCSPDPVVGARS